MTRLPLLALLLPFFSLAQTPTQTLRGTVVDAATLQPLAGATVSLPGTDGPLGTATDEVGNFTLSEVPTGRYRLQANYLGYAPLTLTEVSMEASRETILTIQMWEQPKALGEVTVRAQARENLGHPVSLHTLTVEEQFRLPATFFDPARVAAFYPGVAAPDDQANHLSIRGNSPSAIRWRLEGADIVNPNHTANAGTFSDRPSAAGGGVSILSAQVLDVSNFLTGAFPSGYGNSVGGVMDMRFRHGNDRQKQFTAQAGLIGLEMAAEGPLTTASLMRDDRFADEGRPSPLVSEAVVPRPSFVVNYRYSFTGLLTSFGVDFGGEEIGFQDLSFRLNFPTKNAGEFGMFGMGGASKNIFTSPRQELVEEKDLYDIDFQSKMGAIGLTHVLSTGRKSAWRTVVALSALEHERAAERVALTPSPFVWDDDRLAERKLSVSSIFSKKTSGGGQLRAGLQATQDHADFFTFANDNLGGTELSGTVDGWLLQPFAEWQKHLSEKWKLTGGLHFSHFTFSEKTFVEPRASLSFFMGENTQFHLASGLHSQAQLPQFQVLVEGGRRLSPTRSHHAVLGYHQKLGRGKRLLFAAEAYHQYLFEVPVSTDEGSRFSAVNITGFTELRGEKLVNDGTGRNYGLDLSLKTILGGNSFGMVSGSLYRSRFSMPGGAEQSSRWDGGFLFNLSYGREKTKKTKRGKMRTRGTSTRLVWMGGFRERPISLASSEAIGRTTHEFAAPFSEKLKNYYRFDWRAYLKWERPGRTSMLSLDIQNLLFEENEAFRYFDQLRGEVRVRKQLGFIPILSWRLGF